MNWHPFIHLPLGAKRTESSLLIFSEFYTFFIQSSSSEDHFSSIHCFSSKQVDNFFQFSKKATKSLGDPSSCSFKTGLQALKVISISLRHMCLIFCEDRSFCALPAPLITFSYFLQAVQKRVAAKSCPYLRTHVSGSFNSENKKAEKLKTWSSKCARGYKPEVSFTYLLRSCYARNPSAGSYLNKLPRWNLVKFNLHIMHKIGS